MDKGTYTIQGKTRHITISFYTPRWLRELIAEGRYDAGTLVVGYLRGPDNERDFTGFGFVHPCGRLQIWAKIDQDKLANQIWCARRILDFQGDVELMHKLGMEYAMRSNRCFRCGRTLTVPASVSMGLGPECASKLGVIPLAS